MFRILLLVNIFQQARSVNIALTHINVRPVGCNSLKVTFRVKNEIDHLTGVFSACGGGKCGSASVGSFDQNTVITIPLDLSPCKSYSRIKITSELSGDKDDKKDTTSWKAKAFGNCCTELATTAPTTTTKTSLEGEDSTSPSSGNSTTPVSEAQTNTATIGVVFGVVLVTLIVTAFVTILFKRKRDEKKKQDEEMPVDANPVYGIYDDGALYNVVEDGNDYYES